jgi:hypothetical protein
LSGYSILRKVPVSGMYRYSALLWYFLGTHWWRTYFRDVVEKWNFKSFLMTSNCFNKTSSIGLNQKCFEHKLLIKYFHKCFKPSKYNYRQKNFYFCFPNIDKIICLKQLTNNVTTFRNKTSIKPNQIFQYIFSKCIKITS